MPELKAYARHLFHHSLQNVDVRAATLRSFQFTGQHLVAGGASFDLSTFADILIIAIGKAATPMYEAAVHVLKAAWAPEHLGAIVVSPRQPEALFGQLTFFPACHPIPGETSRHAALAILDELHRVTSDTLVLFLISGGSSAMVEMPLDPAISQQDLATFHHILVGSGLTITQVNMLRKRLSAVKGGRLAEAAAPAAQCTLIVSDVPSNLLDTVGSGPSLPDSSSAPDCAEAYSRLRRAHPLPASIQRFFDSATLSETPRPGHLAFSRAFWTCILSSDDLATATANAASAAGLHVVIDNRCDDWTSEDAAAYLLDRSERLAKSHPRTCLISVGEVVVTLPDVKGCGGRNQHFALQSAIRLERHCSQAVVLSAGSDGIDGSSPAAGAIADQHTCRQALALGIHPLETLRRFDSFRLFNTLGDTITTGPTGNNLRDLRLLLT